MNIYGHVSKKVQEGADYKKDCKAFDEVITISHSKINPITAIQLQIGKDCTTIEPVKNPVINFLDNTIGGFMTEQTRELNGRTVKKAPDNLNEHGTTCDGCVLTREECEATVNNCDSFWHCHSDSTIFIDVK